MLVLTKRDGSVEYLQPRAAGGPGSGNFDHAGRPGEVGGSAIGHVAPVPSEVMSAIHTPDGGFTYSPVTGAQPTTGFALSIHPDREQVIDDSKADVVALADYAVKNWDLLSKDGNYLGGWHSPENGKVYLDVSTVVQTAHEAEQMAREARQLAYFDLVKGESIKLSYGDTHGDQANATSHRANARPTHLRGYHRARAAIDWPRTDRGRNRTGPHDSGRSLGGVGSGNFGHAGRPGAIGGSSESNGSPDHPSDSINVATAEHGGTWYVTHWSDDPLRSFTSTRHAYFHPMAEFDPSNLEGARGALIKGDLTLHHPKVVSSDESVDMTAAGVSALKAQGYDGAINVEGWEVIAFDPKSAFTETTRVRNPYLKGLGGSGSGNFGHAGRPGEVGGSTSEMSATERYNSLYKESVRLTEVAAQAERDRNVITDRLRTEAYTPERTVAEIEKIVYTNPDYLAAEQKVREAGAAATTAAVAAYNAEPAMRVEKVEHRAEAIATQLGIDPAIIHVVDKEPTPFIVGNQQFKEAGHFDPRTGQIEINARNSYDDRMSVTNGIVAHETSHAIYQTVKDAQEREHQEIQALPREEKHRLFQAENWSADETFIKGPRPEMLSELQQKFPASAAFASTWGDVYLTPGISDESRQKMINENGHSAYARAYWTGDAIRQRGTYENAVNETLAEVTRYLVQPSSWHESGEPRPKSPWVELAQSLRAAYPKLKAR